MKANSEQYDKAVSLYEKGGKTAVLAFAEQEGIDAWGTCSECEDSTPICFDGTWDTCLVCGSCNESNN